MIFLEQLINKTHIKSVCFCTVYPTVTTAVSSQGFDKQEQFGISNDTDISFIAVTVWKKSEEMCCSLKVLYPETLYRAIFTRRVRVCLCQAS